VRRRDVGFGVELGRTLRQLQQGRRLHRELRPCPRTTRLATGNSGYDLYDGCILAAMNVAGLSEAWMGQLLKALALNESDITPSIDPGTSGPCGGQNCGPLGDQRWHGTG
jgi:hypothetical protein